MAEMDFLKWKLGFSNGITAGSIGRSGGVACFWTNCVNVEVLSYSAEHIDVIVDSLWRCTGFYGNPNTTLRINSWRLLAGLKGMYDLPWLVRGDFNEIVCSSEKMGGRLRPEGQMSSFRSMLDKCGLHEVRAEGPWFTWKSSRHNGVEILEKLDRVVVSNSWRLRFLDAAVSNVVSSISDHLLVVLDTEQVVGWQRMAANIRANQYGLQNWSREEYGSLSYNIKQKQEMLKSLLAMPDLREVGNAIALTERELKDKWVHGCVNGEVIINPITKVIPVKVAELIFGPGRRWDVNLLRLCFSAEQVRAVESIPLGDGEEKDQWIWNGNAKGVYCAKEGYYVARECVYDFEISMILVESLTSQRLTKLPEPSLDDVFSNPSQLKSIQYVKKFKKRIDEENGWFYETCLPRRDVDFCHKCAGFPKFIIPRFNVELLIFYPSGSTTFVLFENVVMKVVGKIAANIIDQILGRRKSYLELEFEEVKGFIDLVFVFSEEAKKNSILVSLVPGLQRFGEEEKEDKKKEEANNQVPSSIINLKVSSLYDSEEGWTWSIFENFLPTSSLLRIAVVMPQLTFCKIEIL
ncbi:hypothetical protein ACFE04_018604 [Oxalis oulophora]